MSWEAWGDDDDGIDGYVTEERAEEMAKEATEELRAANEQMRALIAELADTELRELACTGSHAPVEDVLGRMFALLTPNVLVCGGPALTNVLARCWRPVRSA